MTIVGVFDNRELVFPVPYPDIGRRAQLPEWYHFPAFGQPRNVDISKLRELSEQPWINACVTTLIDKFASLDWDIVPKDEAKSDDEEIKQVKEFLKSPNGNRETIHNIMKKWAKDLLEIDAAVINKVFSDGSYGSEKSKSIERNIYYKSGQNTGSIWRKETIQKQYRPLNPLGDRELKEIYCYDGSTFQADVDVTGFIYGWYQYSFKIPKATPTMFDRGEICYSMRYPRSDRPYGWSVVQSIEKVVLTLKSQVEYFLGFFRERGMPDGILSILESNEAEIKRLAEHWKRETLGRKHKFGIIGRDVKFTPLTITSRDMEILTTQQWFAKLVMAMFKLNIPIMALRGEAPKAGLESLRRSEMADALKPLMREWESLMDNDIIPEILQVPKEECNYEWKFDVYDLEEDERTRAMQIADTNAQILTVNEVREERGLKSVPWGDEPTNVFNPLGQPGQNPNQKPNQEQKPKAEHEHDLEYLGEKLDRTMKLEKFINWDFQDINTYMIEFLKTYDFPLITGINSKQRKEIKNLFMEVLLQRLTLAELEKGLEKVLGDEATEERVEMIIRTETIKISAESSLDRYEKMGIKKVRWIATPSNRTCESCMRNNNREFSLEDAKGKIPLHPMCRCTYLPVVT